MYSLNLTYDEMLLLDGQCSPESQKIIDRAKREHLHPHELELFGQVIEASLRLGTFSFTRKDMRSCPVCKKQAGYAKRKRSGQYYRKGDTDTSKPLYFRGVSFNEGFITFQGMGDICDECEKKYEFIKSLHSYILATRLPIQVGNHLESLYVKDPMRVCYQCKHEMFESEMGRLDAIMGGKYPGECPKCGAKSLFFGRSHEVTREFRMIKKGEAI